MQRFKKFSDKKDKFIWRDGDIEHHRTNESLVEYTHDNPKQKETEFSHDTSPEGESHENHAATDSFLAHHGTLSPAHKKAIDDYKSSSSSFNHYLRHHTMRHGYSESHMKKLGYSPEKIKAHLNDEKETIKHYHKSAKLLDHVTSHKIEHHHTAFRSGVPGDEKKFPVGHEFTDHGYTGTSFHQHIAGGFGNTKSSISHDHPTYKNHNFRKTIVHVIHVTPGTKGHYLNVHRDVALPREKELLLHRGTRFKVTHHSEGPEYHYIHSRVIGNKPRKLPNEEGGETKSKAPSAATHHGLKIHFTPDQQAMIDKWHANKAAK